MLKLAWLPLLFIGFNSFSQSGLWVMVTHHESGGPVASATVTVLQSGNPAKSGITDTTGTARFENLSAGSYEVEVSHVGFSVARSKIILLEGKIYELSLELEAEHEEEEEVVIQSTRSNRHISDIPTRVEFIAGEELDEKSNMKPGDIRMVLTESTGIQTQQTSVTSANAVTRIQGLDGRYTQVLKDGFPAYPGMSSGLGLLQTPPLDLRQIEVIKGSASTLYGGGAIAGLINLISKRATEERELRFHIDLTSAGGINTSGFFGQKFSKIGVTLFASRNSNKPYDPADIGLSAIPKFERYSLTPRIFYYFSPRTELSLGSSYTNETRTGGDMDFLTGKNNTGFFERNISHRAQTQLKFEHRFGGDSRITLKTSHSFFRRDLSEPSYQFIGRQNSTFSELTYSTSTSRMEWIGGVNLMTDDFYEQTVHPVSPDYYQRSLGFFLQNTWRTSAKFILESGLRGEHVDDYGFVFLPRISALFKWSSQLTSRIGGGLGYKIPNIFTEESERLQYRNVLPVDPAINDLERSYGVNADVNYRTQFGELDFSINQLFFYTRIADPLILQPVGMNYRFVNTDGHFDSRGMETNVKLGYHDFKLFLGYTFTDAYLHEGAVEKQNFLTPKHRLNSVLLYEVHEKWKLGLEGYYFGKQLLSDGTTGRSYWITGFMAEKLWEKFSLYVNFENFLDTRQTKFGSIYNGTISNPVFRDIYAPLDGFVVNGGVKLRL